jgi:HlyD family secretion protein
LSTDRSWFLAPRSTLLFLALSVAACSNAPPAGYPGYVEGEYVLVAAPSTGKLI